jgi:hypothetical protein
VVVQNIQHLKNEAAASTTVSEKALQQDPGPITDEFSGNSLLRS